MIISLEGLSNAGKTTITRKLKNKLIRSGLNIREFLELTSEPGKALDKCFRTGVPLTPQMKALCFATDRLFLYDLKFKAYLNNGGSIITDRYVYTSYVYRIVEGVEIPDDVTPIELMSFIATIANTQAWTSIEEPIIDSDEKCSFNIHWCPLEDVYNAFDCRVQRYLVQGMMNAFREFNPFKLDYQVEVTKTMPAGAKCCNFVINEKKPGESDKWEVYSKLLERKALKRMKERQEK